jgi:hypothetical protein
MSYTKMLYKLIRNSSTNSCFCAYMINKNKHYLTPKGPMSVDGFLGSSGRLSRRQENKRSSEILKEGGPM